MPQKTKSPKSEIVPIDPQQLTTSDIIDLTYRAIAEGITGIVSVERTELFRSLGHLLQRVRSGRFLQTLHEEWNQFREKGRVKDDYMFTDQHQECLQELLDFLDKDTPDEIRFTVLKKVFLTAATETASDRNSVLPQQYMKICRTLTSGEVLVLLATYNKFPKLDTNQQSTSAINYLSIIAEISGLKHPELVENHEIGLIEKNLLTPRLYNDKSGVSMSEYGRFTSLGYAICSFIETYDKLPKPD